MDRRRCIFLREGERLQWALKGKKYNLISALSQHTNVFHKSYPKDKTAIYHSATHESSHIVKSIIDSPYSLVFSSESHNDH